MAAAPNTSAVHAISVVANTLSYLRIDVTGDPGVTSTSLVTAPGIPGIDSINSTFSPGRFYLDLTVPDADALYPLGGDAIVQRNDVGAGFSVVLPEQLLGGSVALIPDGFSYSIGALPATTAPDGGATLALLALGSASLELFRRRS